MKYYIIAGEASGDLHGSNLIKGLKKEDPSCSIRCWGGDLMQEAGAELVKHYKESAIMGFWEVLKNLRKILRNLKECKADILKWKPDVVVLIDYPGFNFKIAKFAHNQGFKVFYYIAPKIWAWKESRGKLLKKYVDKLFIIFPFEVDYFKKRWNIEAFYRGNPLLDSIDRYKWINEGREDFFKRMGLSSEYKYVALVAGSRKGEISYLLPRMLKVIEMNPDKKFLLAAAPSIPISYYNNLIDKYLQKSKTGSSSVRQADLVRNNLYILAGETYSIMKHSAAAIINSGTASLEAAIIGVPQAVCYGASEVSYAIARLVVKIKYISLANLILNKLIFKELIQHSCTPALISDELDRLLNDEPYIKKMKDDYTTLRRVLGGEGSSEAIAKAMINNTLNNTKNYDNTRV